MDKVIDQKILDNSRGKELESIFLNYSKFVIITNMLRFREKSIVVSEK